MTMREFEDILDNELESGSARYNNVASNLECLLDSAYSTLDEETYHEFRRTLKELINEDL